jgi:hypothetical protein
MFDSMIKVERPWRAENKPAVKPARPEPTIMTSYSDILFLWFKPFKKFK